MDKARLGEFADFGNKTTYVAPKTDLEIELVGVMEAVLGHQPIGLKDSFFSLGGDSIKSIQLAAKLKRKDLILKVQDILRAKDVQALAALIKKAERKIDQSTVTGRVQLTPIQRAFFDFELPHPEHYNQSIVLKSRKKLNHEVIRQCLTHLVTHHDALRMVFIEKDGVWSQTHQDNLEAAFSLTYEEISSSEDIYAKIEAVGNKIQSGIDLTKGPLLQVCHFAAEGADRVGLIVHHLIMDGISWRILLEDLAILYDQIDQGNDPGLQPKTDSFKYWSQQLQRYSDSLTAEAAFWTDNSWEVAPNKIQDIAASSKRFFYNNTQMLFLSEDMTERIQTQVHHALDTEINDVLLAGLGLALKDVFDINQSIVQMEGHGREEVIPEVDVNRTVGWFTSVYPFLLSVRSGQALEVL
ncbi:MAG: condensation domain-containing protein, partial [Pseudomonadales bacterium]